MLITRLVLVQGVAMFALITVSAFIAQIVGAMLPRSEIIYVAYEGANPEIYIADVRHSRTYNLSNHRAYDAAPAWSPDGTQIAFMSDRGGRPQIYIMDSNGRNVRLLTTGGGSYAAPRWSADGQRLVFFALGAGQRLYSIRIDGTDFQQISGDEVEAGITMNLDVEPGSLSSTRSRDGAHVLFMRYDAGEWNVFVRDAADNSRREARFLARMGRTQEPPSWARHDTRVAFITYRRGYSELMVVDALLGPASMQRIAAAQAVFSSPSWRP